MLFSSSSDAVVGIPQNNGAFWDGQQYWVMYSENNTLNVRYGSSLDSLTTSTLGSTAGLVNNKTFSVVYGQQNGDWYAWVLANRSGANAGTEEFSMYSWRLTPTGLSDEQSRLIDLTPKPAPSHVTLMPDADDFEIESLYGAIHSNSGVTNQAAIRTIAPDLSSDTGLGGVVMSDTRFAESTWAFEVSNGIVANSINSGDWPVGTEVNGDFGHFSEWTRTSVGSAWGAESVLESPGAGNWSDMNYASDTSHAGQGDFVQLGDGTIFNAYIDNTDKTNGNFGKIVLKERGNTIESDWSTASLNAIAGGDNAWHVSLTSDGEQVWLLYVKDDPDNSGQRDDAIYLRGYDPLTDTFTDETLIAEISDGARFERMTTQWRFADERLVVFWSETADDGLTLDTYATAVAVPEPGAALSMGVVGLLLLNSRRRKSVV